MDGGGTLSLIDSLMGAGAEALRKAGFRTRLSVAGAAGGRFSDPDDPIRIEALERLPGDANLSPKMAERVLDAMARDWTLERIAVAVRQDFPDPDVLDGFRSGVRGDRVRVVPPRLLVQIGAGNVAGTGATALLRAFLVGAPTLLKPGHGDGVLPELMARALAEADPALAAGFAVTPWVGGQGGALEAEALARAERVVVYGGADTVEAIRPRIHPLTPLVIYGPKVSAGVVLREASGDDAVVRDAAAAISAYEQRGCVSPHVIWVEAGGDRTPEAWAEALAAALAAEAEMCPVPSLGTPVLEMRILAEAAQYRAASGERTGVFGGPESGWMVLLEPEPGPFEPTCLGRTVRVRPIADAAQVVEALSPARRVLQTIAVEAGEPRRSFLALELARAGVTRVTTFRDQPWPPAWWRHDGEGPLSALVHWVTLEGKPLPYGAPYSSAC